jgi:hypothetical protein
VNFMGLLIVAFALGVTFLLSKFKKNKLKSAPHIYIYIYMDLYIINIFYIYMYRILFDDKADLGPFLGSWMASRQNVVFLL